MNIINIFNKKATWETSYCPWWYLSGMWAAQREILRLQCPHQEVAPHIQPSTSSTHTSTAPSHATTAFRMTTYIAERVLRISSLLPLPAPHHKRYAAKTTLNVPPCTTRTGSAPPTMTIRCWRWECALNSRLNAVQRIVLCSIRPERPPPRI